MPLLNSARAPISWKSEGSSSAYGAAARTSSSVQQRSSCSTTSTPPASATASWFAWLLLTTSHRVMQALEAACGGTGGAECACWQAC